jgi:hypothetical protein
VLQCIGENAYKIKFLGEYGVCAAFNVSDISPYKENKETMDFRASPHQPGEPDMAMSKNGHLILAQASAQLSPQTQQKVNDHIEEIWMQTTGF